MPAPAPVPLADLCRSLGRRGFFSGEGDGTGEDFAFSFAVRFGVRGSSCGDGAGMPRTPGGRLKAGRVSALAVDSRRGFGMRVFVWSCLHIILERAGGSSMSLNL